MLDYTFLKIIWWMIIGAVLVIYACTAGYDSGITLIMPFLRNETDRRVVLNTSAPTWDGNQTWIVFAGGGLFVVWPVVYSLAFSGLYIVMLCILWSLFFRPPGYDYRSKLPSMKWKRFWDFGLFISSLVPVFMFGVVFGNCFIGFPFLFAHDTFRELYTGSMWSLFSFFGILSGLVSLLMILMHGAAYGQRRTEDHLRKMFGELHLIFSFLLFIGFTLAGYLLVYHMGSYELLRSALNPTLNPTENIVQLSTHSWLSSYHSYSWKFFAPLIAYAGMGATIWANLIRWYAWCFWSSAVAIGGIIMTAGFTLFPFIMPSSTNPNQSLTVWNSVSTQYALNIMFYVGIILLLVILGYKAFTFHTLWGKKGTVTEKDLKENEHTFY